MPSIFNSNESFCGVACAVHIYVQFPLWTKKRKQKRNSNQISVKKECKVLKRENSIKLLRWRSSFVWISSKSVISFLCFDPVQPVNRSTTLPFKAESLCAAEYWQDKKWWVKKIINRCWVSFYYIAAWLRLIAVQFA